MKAIWAILMSLVLAVAPAGFAVSLDKPTVTACGCCKCCIQPGTGNSVPLGNAPATARESSSVQEASLHKAPSSFSLPKQELTRESSPVAAASSSVGAPLFKRYCTYLI